MPLRKVGRSGKAVDWLSRNNDEQINAFTSDGRGGRRKQGWRTTTGLVVEQVSGKLIKMNTKNKEYRKKIGPRGDSLCPHPVLALGLAPPHRRPLPPSPISPLHDARSRC